MGNALVLPEPPKITPPPTEPEQSIEEEPPAVSQSTPADAESSEEVTSETSTSQSIEKPEPIQLDEDTKKLAEGNDDVGNEGGDLNVWVGIAIVVGSAVAWSIHNMLRALLRKRRRGGENGGKLAVVSDAPGISDRGEGVAACRFYVSENFKVDGEDMSLVRHEWQRPLSLLTESSKLVEDIREGGAQWMGKVVTADEPSSIENEGDKVLGNPSCSGCVCGGPCTGAAVSVGTSLADFSLATDTTGGIRVCAACCGLYGFRTTHGSVSTDGIAMRAPSLESVGFFSKDLAMMNRMGDMLNLPGKKDWKGDVMKLLLARDLFNAWFDGESTREVYLSVARACLKWAGSEYVEEVDLADFLSTYGTGWKEFAEEDQNVYEALRRVAMCIALYEAKQIRFKEAGLEIEETPQEIEERELYNKAVAIKKKIQLNFKQGIAENKLVIFPGMMQPPPPRSADPEARHKFMTFTQQLCALSTLVGCPQFSFPIRNRSNDLFSISIVSLNKSDRQLLAIGSKLVDLTDKTFAAILQKEERKKEVAKAKNNSAMAKESKETEAEKWKETGNEYFRGQKYEQAVAAYSEAIKKNPKAVYYNNRAMALINLAEFAHAEEDCNAALKLENVNAKAYLRRAVARKALNKLQDAKGDFEKVLAIEPNNRQAQEELKDLQVYLTS